MGPAAFTKTILAPCPLISFCTIIVRFNFFLQYYYDHCRAMVPFGPLTRQCVDPSH